MKYMFYLILLITTAANALETDQFIAAEINLKDSSVVMNDYFKTHMERALLKANNKHFSCEQTALEIMHEVTGRWSISQASTFASASPLIERYPYDAVSERGYKNMSFYEHAWIPLQVVDLARTININGIYIGTDKFGHITHMGMNYYKTYLKLIKKGTPINEAIREAIIKGFGSEYGILGYGIDGVLSYGDLEANYQGFMLALDMCLGENPILINQNGDWVENFKHRLDIKNYVTPKMDESYNLSFWRKPLYKRLKDKIIAEYCETQKSKKFQERVLSYKMIEKENLNDLLVRENIATQSKFDRVLENPEQSCNN